MAKTIKQIKGGAGEKKAIDFLIKNEYLILEKNYRFQKAEIDIIAQKENFILFIEVKTRKNSSYGYPEDFVSERKKELFHETAEYYMDKNNIMLNLRFDIIAIVDNEIIHFKDAF